MNSPNSTFLPTAENVPMAKHDSTKDMPSTQAASQLIRNKHELNRIETSTKPISGTISDTKEQGKAIGNPGWPSKTENTVVGPSITSKTTKGMKSDIKVIFSNTEILNVGM